MAINSLSTGFRPGVCTSGTRPTAPYEGQQIYETNTDKTLVWNGSAWLYLSTPQTTEIGGAWETYVPAVTQNAAIGKTTNYSRYGRINKIVTWAALFQFTGAGSAGYAITTTLPIAAPYGGSFAVFGKALFYDTSINRTYLLTAGSTTGGNLAFWYDGVLNFFGAAPSVTVANGDWLSFTITYEAA